MLYVKFPPLGLYVHYVNSLLPPTRRLCFRSGLYVCVSVCKISKKSYEWISKNFWRAGAWLDPQPSLLRLAAVKSGWRAGAL